MLAIKRTVIPLHLCWIAALILSSLLYVWPTLIKAQADYYLAEKIERHTAWQEAQRLRDSTAEAEREKRYRRLGNGNQ